MSPETEAFLKVIRIFSSIEEDEFNFSIHYSDRVRGKPIYLEIKEKAEGHIFFDIYGTSIPECCDAAIAGLPGCCKNWKYNVPKIQ